MMNPPTPSIWQRQIFPKIGVVLFLRWFFSWRTIRRVWFVLACLATLTAIFYAEEDWRGHRAWEHYKRSREAKGEKFDWQAFIPPPVPDDQNFAMSPFFADVQRIWQSHKGENQAYDTNWNYHLGMGFDMPFHASKAITIPTFGDWEKATNINLAAWQHYFSQPIPAMAKNKYGWDGIPFPAKAQPQTPAADVLLALSKYDDVLQLLRTAAEKPFSRFPIDYDDEVFYILVPHLGKLNQTAKFLELQTAAFLEAGKINEAAANVNLMFYLTDSCKSEPFLISYLVRSSMFEIDLTSIWDGLLQHCWSAENLEGFEEKLASQSLLGDFENSIEFERIACCHYIDDVQREPSIAGQNLLTDEEVYDNVDLKLEKKWRRKIFLLLAPVGWFDDLKVEWSNEGFDFILDSLHPNENRVNFKPVDFAKAESNLETAQSRLWITRGFLANCFKSLQKAIRAQTSLYLGATACALERYWLAHGQYPEKLDELVPQFIQKIPGEVTNGQPLKYHRTSTGGFVLYSTGLTGEDFGGERYDAQGNRNGNWVWSSEANSRQRN